MELNQMLNVPSTGHLCNIEKLGIRTIGSENKARKYIAFIMRRVFEQQTD